MIHRMTPAEVVAALDAASRRRALSDRESAVLEHFIGVEDGSIPATDRAPSGSNKVITRLAYEAR
jgi:hypothetical protein